MAGRMNKNGAVLSAVFQNAVRDEVDELRGKGVSFTDALSQVSGMSEKRWGKGISVRTVRRYYTDTRRLEYQIRSKDSLEKKGFSLPDTVNRPKQPSGGRLLAEARSLSSAVFDRVRLMLTDPSTDAKALANLVTACTDAVAALQTLHGDDAPERRRAAKPGTEGAKTEDEPGDAGDEIPKWLEPED